MTPAQLTDRFRACNDLQLSIELSRHVGNMRGGGYQDRDDVELNIIRDEVTARASRPNVEAELAASVDASIAAARDLSPGGPEQGRCRALIVTKLEEARHRVLEY